VFGFSPRFPRLYFISFEPPTKFVVYKEHSNDQLLTTFHLFQCVIVLPIAVMSDPRLADSDDTSPPSEEREDVEMVHDSKTDVESTTGADVTEVLQNERDIVTHVISVHDDPSLNPWTFRSFFIGVGLSAFGGVLGKR
jgi:hypothetical protein